MLLRRSAICWFALLMGSLVCVATLGASPTTLRFEGEFYDTPYGSLTDEVYSMQFSIYDAVEGGGKLWPSEGWVETHPFVYVTRGRFSVVLGDEGFPLTPNVHTGREVYVQVAVCLPAGYECGEHEPLPIRMPLQTTATIATPIPSTPSAPSTPPADEEDGPNFLPTGSPGDHMHWGQTWVGIGIGLDLVTESVDDQLRSIGLRGASTVDGLSFGLLGEVSSGEPLSAGVKGTATRSVGVMGIGDTAYDTSIGGYFAGWMGVYAEASGMNAPGLRAVSRVNTGIGVWGESSGALGYGGYFEAPSGTGLYVGDAGIDGLYILQAQDDGLEIHNAGLALKQSYPSDFELGETRDAISIGGAAGFGLWLGFAGRSGIGIGEAEGHGLWVLDAGEHGVRIGSADACGLSIGRTEQAGIHIAHAGTSGLVVDYAAMFGVHATSEGAAAVYGESTRGPGGEFTSEASHAVVADGPTLIGGRTPEQIGMLKWYEARETPDTISTRAGPIGLAFDGQSVWIAHDSDEGIHAFPPSPSKLIQLNANDGVKVRELNSTRSACIAGPVHDGLRLWYVNQDHSLIGTFTGFEPGAVREEVIAECRDHIPLQGPVAMAFDGRHIWIGTTVKVLRFTLTDEPYEHLPGSLGFHRTSWGTVQGAMLELESHRIRNGCTALAFDGTYMWIAVPGVDQVLKMHAENMSIDGIYDVGDGPSALAFDGANMWVANLWDNTVTKLRVSDGQSLGTYAVGNHPRALVFDGFHIWVANEGDNTLTKLRAVDGSAVGTYETGRSPRALVFDGTHVWVANYDDDTLMKF